MATYYVLTIRRPENRNTKAKYRKLSIERESDLQFEIYLVTLFANFSLAKDDLSMCTASKNSESVESAIHRWGVVVVAPKNFSPNSQFFGVRK